MAIVTQTDPIFNDLLGGECFYCGNPVYPPAVMWMGHGEDDLLLHAPCVLALFLRLGRDVWQIECDTDQYVARTPLFDLRTRLIGEEMGQVRP